MLFNTIYLLILLDTTIVFFANSGDRSQGSSTIRSSLSANFVENIGQKKRNKDQKKQFSALTSGSPLHSSSSNSSAAGSLNDLIVRSRSR